MTDSKPSQADLWESESIPSNINFCFITLSEGSDTPGETCQPSMSESLSGVLIYSYVSLKICKSENFNPALIYKDIGDKMINQHVLKGSLGAGITSMQLLHQSILSSGIDGVGPLQ